MKIQTLDVIRPYDPNYHTQQIKWFRTPLILGLNLGQNESVIPNCKTDLYPKNCIVVKCQRAYDYTVNQRTDEIGFVEILFMGDIETRWHGNTRAKREKVQLLRYNDSKIINAMFFSNVFGYGLPLDKGAERLTYINYIISQLNTLRQP